MLGLMDIFKMLFGGKNNFNSIQIIIQDPWEGGYSTYLYMFKEELSLITSLWPSPLHLQYNSVKRCAELFNDNRIVVCKITIRGSECHADHVMVEGILSEYEKNLFISNLPPDLSFDFVEPTT